MIHLELSIELFKLFSILPLNKIKLFELNEEIVF